MSKQLSIRSIMIVLIIVAVDGATLRSIFLTEFAEMRSDSFDEWVIVSLAMLNSIAVVLSRIVRDGIRARPSRLGFLIGAVIGLALSWLGAEPAVDEVLSLVDEVLSLIELSNWGPALDSWMNSSPILDVALTYGFIGGLSFVFQMIFAVLGSWAVRLVKFREVSSSKEIAPSRRRRVASVIALLVLIVLPFAAIEVNLHRKFEPYLVRLAAGKEAILDFGRMDPLAVSQVTRLQPPPMDGARVRVVIDGQPCVRVVVEAFEVVEAFGNDQQTKDYRAVRVTILDGDRAGETVVVARRFLRPAR